MKKKEFVHEINIIINIYLSFIQLKICLQRFLGVITYYLFFFVINILYFCYSISMLIFF
jgi:hypothetical protein